MTPEIVVAPLLVPLLVIVPVGLMLALEIVTAPVVVVVAVMFPVPLMAPLIVSVPAAPANTTSSFSVIAPLNVGLFAPLWIVAVPLLIEATVIGLAYVWVVPPDNVTLAFTVPSPSVIVPLAPPPVTSPKA